MAELGRCFETVSLGHDQYQTTVGIKPINFYNGHAWEREVVDFVSSGISVRPHMVGASQLMVSVADDGDFRAHPTREQDRYLEFGAPLIKVAGNWVRPGFGNRTREDNRLKWTTDYENAYIVHAGHYIKWGILLKNNFDRWSQFAMPVGLTGLTRAGGQLYADGVPVMHLRAPVVYDYDNEEDTRQIAHEFVKQGEQWYALFTLPDLTGMSKPLIDPTLELQPGPGVGKDTDIKESEPDNIYPNDVNLDWELKAGFIYFDVSPIPGDSIVDSATLFMWNAVQKSGSRSNSFYNMLVANSAWIEACSWNYSVPSTVRWAGDTGNDGGADAGCTQSGVDYAATKISELVWPDNNPSNTEASDSITTSVVQDWVDGANYGMCVPPNGGINVRASEYATAANRPKLVTTYTWVGINISAENPDSWKRGVKIYIP